MSEKLNDDDGFTYYESTSNVNIRCDDYPGARLFCFENVHLSSQWTDKGNSRHFDSFVSPIAERRGSGTEWENFRDRIFEIGKEHPEYCYVCGCMGPDIIPTPTPIPNPDPDCPALIGEPRSDEDSQAYLEAGENLDVHCVPHLPGTRAFCFANPHQSGKWRKKKIYDNATYQAVAEGGGESWQSFKEGLYQFGAQKPEACHICGCTAPDGTPTPTPIPECSIYTFNVRQDGGKIFTGAGAELPCIQQMAKDYCWSLSRARAGGRELCDDQIAVKFLNMARRRSGNDTARAWYINKNCRAVDAPTDNSQICGHLTISYIPSPISLIMDPEVDITDVTSITSFPLIPGMEGNWYIWRASTKTPLLVYDPLRNAKVASASQLFGNWTFGGNRTAGLNSQITDDLQARLPRPWENGYQALATLDTNGDQRISGDELDLLSLWFDHNQDGKAQDGEIVPIKKAGIKALFFEPSHTDLISGDIHARIGYEREVDGRIETGPSVDWFGEGFSSKFEAIAKVGMRETLYRQTTSSEDRETKRISQQLLEDHNTSADNTAAAGSVNLSGPWVWEIDEAHISGNKNPELSPKGMLIFRHKGGDINGHSYVEVPLSKPMGEADRFILQFPLQGRSSINADGQTTLIFKLQGENGAQTMTVATLSDDSLRLKGKSSMVIKSVSTSKASEFSYDWTAQRFE